MPIGDRERAPERKSHDTMACIWQITTRVQERLIHAQGGSCYACQWVIFSRR
ncbi:hypothetical protein D3C84_1274170 [compost metagenome]